MLDNVCCFGGSRPELTTFTLFYLPINEAGIRGHQRYSRDEVGEMRNRGRTHKLAIRQVNST